MKYIKQGTVSQLETDTFRAKGVLYAHDLPKVLWCEQPEAGTEFTIKYNAETGKTVADEINYVDLGLPSGLLWATCNVGATKPEEYGKYFQWGDTIGYEGDEAKTHSYWSTTPYQTTNRGAIYLSYADTRFTKYLGSTTSIFKSSSASDEDALKTVLDPDDDAATVIMGGDWRMPTFQEMNELKYNTIQQWLDNDNTEFNGVAGCKFISKSDSSKYIFIPVAGRYDTGSMYQNQTKFGYLWSSSLSFNSRYPYYACGLFISNNEVSTNYDMYYRHYSYSIRAVKPKK